MNATAVCSLAKEVGLSTGDISKLPFVRNGADIALWYGVAVMILRTLFPLATFAPDSVSYKAKKDANWSQRAWLDPLLIFTPGTAEDVAKGLKVIKFFSVPFAIRSGGHTPFPGSASSDGGILISLEALNAISVDSGRGIASVGPGNRWKDVYGYLEPYGLGVVGGRLPPVGVGGLITGGGVSFFSTAHGLACDNVAAFQVVLADSSIVTASATENNDLFWALKGGSSNFGIVTRFDLYTLPIPGAVWGGALYYTSDKFSNVSDAIAEYQGNGQVKDPDAAVIPIFTFMAEGLKQTSMVTVFHPTTEKPAALKGFFEAGPAVDTTKRRGLPDMVLEAMGGAAAGTVAPQRLEGRGKLISNSPQISSRDFRTLSIGVSAELYRDIISLFQATFLPFEAVAGFGVSITFQPIAASTVTKGKSRGPNPLGLEEAAQTWLVLSCGWTLESDDEKVLATGASFLDKVDKMAAGKGLSKTYLYLNDAAMDQRPIHSYGHENLQRLKRISREYDPDGVFQRLAKGGFKLSP